MFLIRMYKTNTFIFIRPSPNCFIKVVFQPNICAMDMYCAVNVKTKQYRRIPHCAGSMFTEGYYVVHYSKALSCALLQLVGRSVCGVTAGVTGCLTAAFGGRRSLSCQFERFVTFSVRAFQWWNLSTCGRSKRIREQEESQ